MIATVIITEDEIKKKADELATYTLQLQIIKGKIDNLKGFFENLATETLNDTKLKTAEYWGNQNVKITVSNSETVKPVSIYMLKQVFGDVFPDFVKEEINYKMTDPCKRLLAMACQGDFTEGSLSDTVKSIAADTKIQQTLKKKLKGRFEKDKATLMNVAGLPENEASDWAYLASEVINYEWLAQILKTANWKGRFEDAVQIIKSAIMVDEGIKVSVATEEA